MYPTGFGDCCGITRRGFLLGAAAGVAAAAPLTWLALRGWQALHSNGSTFSGHTKEQAKPPFAMPGPFPGRVVEVRRADAVSRDHRINQQAVNDMIDRGMTELTGADDPSEAWKRFFEPGDVVGIKVNPVGRKPKRGEPGRMPHAVGSISSPEVLLQVVAGLKCAGVRPRDIIVFERYAEEFIDAGYEKVMYERAMDGVRWCASAARYHGQQVDIEGFDEDRSKFSPELVKHVVGYDPDVFVHMGFASPEHDPKDDRAVRTHLSVIVSRLVNKLVTIPVLKDHRSAGVTLCLKNLSHGLNNNVARSHLSGYSHGGIVASGKWPVAGKSNSAVATRHWPLATSSGPNQCNTFIPTAVAQPPTRRKATLHILDGLIGVYEGGPGNWNKTWGTWRHRGLLFATDPVALDHVGWDIINRQRAAEGWAPVEQMGLLAQTRKGALSRHLAGLSARGLADALTLSATAAHFQGGLASESFDRRQPEHIILASTLGLGRFDPREIEYRQVEMTR
jgi:hypothetical protein